MAEKIIMPKTGMAMEEGTILEWFKAEGDIVEKGDIVAEIETDKATMELETDYSGTILKIVHQAGETVPVVETIAWIGTSGETIPVDTVKEVKSDTEFQKGSSAEQIDSDPDSVPNNGRVKSTPSAKRLAKEKNITLGSVSPSGKHGEILERDVAGALSTGSVPKARPLATPLAARMAAEQNISITGIPGSGHHGKIFSNDLAARQNRSINLTSRTEDRRVALTKIQKITGKRMLQSQTTIPTVTENIRVDVSELLDIRKRLNETLEAKITVNDFVLMAVVKALKDNPRMNATLDEEDVIYKGAINLGMAVATPRGLVVPVIHNADECTLSTLSTRAKDLAARGREGKLTPSEMEGGSFTISNVGMYGITSFTPIINPPEAGILGVCAIEDHLILNEGNVESRKVMGLSLTFDHRIVDGAESALFLKGLKDYLEAPLMILA